MSSFVMLHILDTSVLAAIKRTLTAYFNPNLSSFDIAFRSFSLSAAAFLPSPSLSASNFPLPLGPSPVPVVDEVEVSVLAACFFASTKSFTCWISASVIGMSVGGLRIIFAVFRCEGQDNVRYCGAQFTINTNISANAAVLPTCVCVVIVAAVVDGGCVVDGCGCRIDCGWLNRRSLRYNLSLDRDAHTPLPSRFPPPSSTTSRGAIVFSAPPLIPV